MLAKDCLSEHSASAAQAMPAKKAGAAPPVKSVAESGATKRTAAKAKAKCKSAAQQLDFAESPKAPKKAKKADNYDPKDIVCALCEVSAADLW